MSKKIYLYIIMLIVSIAIIGLSFLFQGESLKTVSGVFIGAGAGLLGLSISNLGMALHYQKYPAAAKRAEIEVKDERNKIIQAKAKATAADVTKWFIIALAFIMILLNAPLWATLCIIAVFSLYHVLTMFFMARYQKQM